jgi:L-2-hydroxyglutarate oxidase LhgO
LDRFDYCIIGAGVIGLAIAYKLSQSQPKASILLIERHGQFGTETSSRNSEVIHAGIYYPNKSLKAELCLQGKEQIYQFCQAYKVPYKKIGKLILAKDENDLAQLETLRLNAYNNRVDLQLLSQRQCQRLEPQVQAAAALFSPTTGIIDSHSFMQTLLTLAEQQSTLYCPNTELLRAEKKQHGFNLYLKTSEGEYLCHSQFLINSAGLQATEVAAKIDAMTIADIPQYHLCKGHYFHYQGRAPFSHLIYPLPNKNTTGLGIHATLDLAGQVRFGPDTEYIKEIDYAFPDNSYELKEKFSHAIKDYFPNLDSSKLVLSYSGIRPKLSQANEAAKDFVIQDWQQHKVPGLINLLGIESPGLTSSLAIADRVLALTS